MTNQTHNRFDRRRFLRGLGLSLAIPSLESLRPGKIEAAAGDRPKARNFVCVAPDYGLNPEGFFPQQTGDQYAMPNSLKALARHRQEFSIFSQLDHPDVGGGHGCTRTLLNGIKAADANGDRSKLFSLDQLVAERIGSETRFPSLVTGNGAPISYTRAGIPIPSVPTPDRFFNLLFVEDSEKDKQRQRQSLSDNGSLLDLLLDDSRSLKNKLATQDRNKLEEYLTAVRETERKLVRRKEWINIPKPKAKRPRVDEDQPQTSYPYDMSLFFEVMVMALQTESTRVMVYQMPGGNRHFTFDGITLGYHTLTHHGQNPEKIAQLQIIDNYYLSQLAGFIDRLKKVKDVDGQPLLDSTVLLLGSGMGNASSHSSRNVPALVAGGGFKHGQHHTFPKQGNNGTPLSNLYVTLLQQFGIETDQFASSRGNLNNVLS
jgi:hypothetical protein